MRASELKAGRTFAVAFDHADDFMTTLARFCRDHGVQQGYIPMFLAGFAEADVAGTCEKLDNPDAPVGPKVHVTNVEALVSAASLMVGWTTPRGGVPPGERR